MFVDTGALLALADSRDNYHTEANETAIQLEKQGAIWITTNLIVAESYTLILRRGGYSAAIRFLEFIRNSGNILLIYSTLESEVLAETILRKYKDQEFSFVDAVSFAIMHEQNISTAFGFDSHFLVAGFQLTPGPTR
jgi:predicted nucleic acid-binding protein